jgi:hypothetical protein
VPKAANIKDEILFLSFNFQLTKPADKILLRRGILSINAEVMCGNKVVWPVCDKKVYDGGLQKDFKIIYLFMHL